MNNNVRSLIRKRNRFHKIAKIKNSPSAWGRFRLWRNKVVSAVRSAKREYVKKTVGMIINTFSDKHWWKLVNSYMKKNQKTYSFPPLISNDIVNDDLQDIVETLNDYFTQQSCVDNPNSEPPDIHPKQPKVCHK